MWHGTNDNRANVVAVATVGRTMHRQLGAELMKPSAMIESEMSPPLLLHAREPDAVTFTALDLRVLRLSLLHTTLTVVTLVSFYRATLR